MHAILTAPGRFVDWTITSDSTGKVVAAVAGVLAGIVALGALAVWAILAATGTSLSCPAGTHEVDTTVVSTGPVVNPASGQVSVGTGVGVGVTCVPGR